MWIPASAIELLRAIEDAVLPHEAANFDVKAQLPEPRANKDIAIDVAAMATDGGVIIYGVRENKEAMTFTPTPFALAGVLERLSDVVSANVSERIDFDIRLLPLEDDSTMGFVVLDIPASIRAPHMVETRGEFRYYRRVPGGNAPLTEAQIAQLYDRRRQVENEADLALDAAIDAAPVLTGSERRGDLHLVARPLLSDRGLRGRVLTGDEGIELGYAVVRAYNAIRFNPDWDPKFSDIIQGGRSVPTLDGFALFNPPIIRGTEQIDDYVSRLEVLDDGTTRYFHAALTRAADYYVVRDTAAAQLAAHFALMVGHLLEAGGYHGHVDMFVALTGAAEAASTQWWMGNYFPPLTGYPGVPTDNYRHRVRVPAAKLRLEPCDISAALLGRLLRTIRPSGFPDPLAR
jgi:hypothetical protein